MPGMSDPGGTGSTDLARAGSRSPAATTVAAVVVALVVVLSAAYVPLFLLVANVHPRVFGFPGGACASALVFAAMGFLIARRYPGNPVGWLMLAVAVLAIILADAGLYALLVYRAGHANLPLGPVAAWLGTTLWSVALSLLAVGLLLFPDGRLVSRGWRAVLWACIAVDAAFVCALGLFALTTIIGAPVSIGLDGQLSAMSKVNGVSGNPFGAAFLALFPFLLATLVVAAAGLITNTRRSHGERRQQLKWFMYAAALSAIGLGVYEVSVFTMGPSTGLAQAGSFLVILGLCALPVSAAVAVFKYHLYDIDVVISRTLVYGSLAALITGVYVGDRGGHRRPDRQRGQAQPWALHPGDGDRRGGFSADTRPSAARRQPARLRKAGHAIRGAEQVLGPGRRDLRCRRCAATHGQSPVRGHRRGDGDSVAPSRRATAPGGDVSSGRGCVARGGDHRNESCRSSPAPTPARRCCTRATCSAR